jgi:ATP-binding cassette, subfamily B, bacterial
MFHQGNWWSYIQYDEEQDRPSVDRALLRRVLAYARPYRGLLVAVIGTIVLITLISLVPPLLMRDLVDSAIPAGDLGRVTLLGIGMIAVPLLNGVVGVVQRWASARAGSP